MKNQNIIGIIQIQANLEIIDMIKDLQKNLYIMKSIEQWKRRMEAKHIKWMKDEEELDHNTMHKKDHSE